MTAQAHGYYGSQCRDGTLPSGVRDERYLPQANSARYRYGAAPDRLLTKTIVCFANRALNERPYGAIL